MKTDKDNVLLAIMCIGGLYVVTKFIINLYI